MAIVGASLAALAGLAVVASVVSPSTDRPDRVRIAASLGPSAASLATPSPHVALPALAATRQAELRVRVASAPAPAGVRGQLEVAGWIPDQFGWAAVDVLAASVPVASIGRQVSADGKFAATIPVPSSARSDAGIVVRLSGLTEVQLTAVPLVSIVIIAPPFGTSPLDQHSVLPR